MHYLEEKIGGRLNEKLKILNSYRPLPESAVRKIREQFEIEMTYNSNAIEGNSLTLKETYLVINEGITIKGKPLKDHLEAKSHKEALDYLYESVSKDKRNTISERLIRLFHQIVTQDIDREWAGKYRNSAVLIGGADHKPPEAIEVPKLMENLIKWIGKNQKKLHPVELAAIIHHKITAIHPFFDGNGRTARLIMNVILMRAGYPLSVILKNDRKKYYHTLAQADKKDSTPFVRFIFQSVERSLDIYLKVLTPGKPREKFISLEELSRGTKYSPKYLNLLARTGKLEAHKEGRIWVVSKEALKRYLEGRERKR
ncbi:MAG: Fic family protein [Candidatus Nealsonbacteria bacterium]|nr:Fic family protein [Candidatus Nealsonbacteria bacterium]